MKKNWNDPVIEELNISFTATAENNGTHYDYEYFDYATGEYTYAYFPSGETGVPIDRS